MMKTMDKGLLIILLQGLVCEMSARLTSNDVLQVRNVLIDFFKDNRERLKDAEFHEPLIPTAVRFLGHDCMGSGMCDGCFNTSHSFNHGPLTVLYNNVNKLYKLNGTMGTNTSIEDVMNSNADYYVLLGTVALELALRQPDERNYEKELQPVFEYKAGRASCPTAPHGAAPTFPFATHNFTQTMDFFADNFNFSQPEVTALLGGVHSLGRLRRSVSGFEGLWVDDPELLDNALYKDLVEKNWRQIKVSREYDEFEKWQWNGVNVWETQSDEPSGFAMLDSDMVLLRDLNLTSIGEEQDQGCKADSQLCPKSPAHGLVRKYADDIAVWFEDFRSAFAKFVDFGHPNLYLVYGPSKKYFTPDPPKFWRYYGYF